MNYRLESIMIALGYLEDARRELAGKPLLVLADTKIELAVSRIQKALEIAPSAAAVQQVIEAGKV